MCQAMRYHAAYPLRVIKCEFAKATVTYLGKQVGQGQVRPVQQKVAAIDQKRNYAFPRSGRVLPQFL